MKHVKKLLGLLLALTLSLTLCLPAFAANGTNDNSGSITINNAEVGHTYSIYQVMVLESYDTDKKAYAYKAHSDWAGWLKTQTQYVSIDDQGYITWVGQTDDSTIATFAKEALAHAKEAGIQPSKQPQTASAPATGAQYSTVTFRDLNLGYYLVDTTLGTLCSLDTIIPNVTMQEKNDLPKIEKEVQEDSTGDWGDKNTAEIGDTVEFKTTITAKNGAQSYELHDEMSKGLTLNANSIKVQVGGSDLAATNYTVKTSGLTDECDFEIEFAQDYLDTLTQDTNIVVTYTAVVNENAKVYGVPNTNKTKLEFGDDHRDETTWDETKTYTFKVDVVKTDDDDKVLDGVQFKLYDAKTGGNEIALVKVSDGVYRLAMEGETGVEYITTVNGQLEIKGFDANTSYYLEETKAPDGYHKLAERVEIPVKDANLEASVSNDTWVSGGVQVINEPGKALPSTGGMGTALFYIGGGVLVVGAAALFVLKKRKDTGK